MEPHAVVKYFDPFKDGGAGFGTVMLSHDTAAAFVVNCHGPLSDCLSSPLAAADITDATNKAAAI